jgi:hypothetical protein
VTLQPGEENDVRKARSTSFACHRTSWLSSPLAGNGSKSSAARACIDGEGTSNETLEKVGRPLSGVNRSARAPAPRPFASFLLPLGALPGPRLRAVASYAHSPPRLRHVLHLGLSPLQPSFLPEEKELRQRRGKKNGPTIHKRLQLIMNSVQSHLPLQKLHAISVFFLNRRRGVNPSDGPFILCFPLRAVLIGLSPSGSLWPASEEELSNVVGGPGTSSRTESNSGLAKSSALEISGRP